MTIKFLLKIKNLISSVSIKSNKIRIHLPCDHDLTIIPLRRSRNGPPIRHVFIIYPIDEGKNVKLFILLPDHYYYYLPSDVQSLDFERVKLREIITFRRNVILNDSFNDLERVNRFCNAFGSAVGFSSLSAQRLMFTYSSSTNIVTAFLNRISDTFDGISVISTPVYVIYALSTLYGLIRRRADG